MKDTVTSCLGANLHMKGEITGSDDLVIEGAFEGLVQLGEGKLTIEKTARVTADIIVGEVLVYGVVKGDVRAKSLIEVKKNGSVDGNLNTAQIAIEDGAFFKGSIDAETTHTVEPRRPKSAEVEQPVPQQPVPPPKDARVPSFWLTDTPQSPAKTVVNKRATTSPLLRLPASSIKSVKAPRRLRRIAIAAAAIATVFAAGRIAVQPHSQKTLKDGKTSAALYSPATSEPKQTNGTSTEIRHRNLLATRTQNIPRPPVTRNTPTQNANARSPVPGSEAVSNYQGVAPAPLAMTPAQIPNSTGSSGPASHPPAEPTTQAVPTPEVPTSPSESKPVQTPVQTLTSRPAQTGAGTTQSKDSNAASSPSNSSAVPAETSPAPTPPPTATDKGTSAAPPKQPEASEPAPAPGTVNPSAPPASGTPTAAPPKQPEASEPTPAPRTVNPSAPSASATPTAASGTPTETNSKKPRGAERLQRGKVIKRVDPVYPANAQRNGIQGRVKVHVVFSPEGTVTNVTFVSGPQELAKAAMDAVRQWRYSPTLFDGKPVEFEDEVTIEFRMAKSKPKKDKDEDDDEPM